MRESIETWVGEPYSRANVDRDILSLRALLFDHGLVDGTVVATAEPMSNEMWGRLALEFIVYEGEPYRFGSVRLTGLSAGEAKVVLDTFETRTQAVYVRTAVGRDTERLRSFVVSKGVEAKVNALLVPDASARTVDITFVVETVPQ